MPRFAALVIALSFATVARADPDLPTITVAGYLELDYQLHLQDPDNRITNLRGFDNRSRTFTLQNVALDAKAEQGPVTSRIVLQVGHTPSSYYLGEPALPGATGVGATNGELWKYIQTATLAIKASRALLIEAGLFPSPIGPEVLPVKDNWNWSRSDLFFGLPFYHTGARVSRPLGHWTATAAVYNGWNSVTDNNGTPSIAASAAYANGKRLAQVLYFGGVERSAGAPEGKPWRHVFDAYVQQPLTTSLTMLAHADAGFERTAQGTNWWVAGALYGKLALTPTLDTAVRIDAFRERVVDGASAIFWPTTWIGSGTLTLSYQPVANTSLRLEYRHDHAASNVFFGGRVEGDGLAAPFVFDRDTQDTVTVGATAWF